MDNQTTEQKQTTMQPAHTLEHAGIPTEQARTLATFIGVDKAVPPAVDNAMAKAMEIFVTKDEFKLELAKVRAEMVTKDDLMRFQMTRIDRMNESNLAMQAQIGRKFDQIDKKFNQLNKQFDQLKFWVPTMVVLLVGALNSLMALWIKTL